MQKNISKFEINDISLDLRNEILDKILEDFDKSEKEKRFLEAQILMKIQLISQELWETCDTTKNSGIKLGCLKQLLKCIDMEVRFRQDIGQLPYVHARKRKWR